MPEDLTIATVITDIGSIITGFVSWAGNILGLLLGNPVILFAVLLPFAISVIYIVYRLIKNRGAGRKRRM